MIIKIIFMYDANNLFFHATAGVRNSEWSRESKGEKEVRSRPEGNSRVFINLTIQSIYQREIENNNGLG